MGYIQELNSLSENLNFTNQEQYALIGFYARVIDFKQRRDTELKIDSNLKSAILKLRNYKKYDEYINLLKQHLDDAIDETFRETFG